MPTDEFVEVETTHGRIKGVHNEGVSVFKGIPYGPRVSGDRRFRRPAPPEPWMGVRQSGSKKRVKPCLFQGVCCPSRNPVSERPVCFLKNLAK